MRTRRLEFLAFFWNLHVRQTRILPLAGPALVLYLVAHMASQAGGLYLHEQVVALIAVASSVTAVYLRRHRENGGARRVGLLGVAIGAGLSTLIDLTPIPAGVEMVQAAALAAIGGLLIDLTHSVPDTPTRLQRGGWVRALTVLVAAGAGALGIAQAIPPADVAAPAYQVLPATESWFAPASWRVIPASFAAAATAYAVAVRAFRGRLGSNAEALASNVWGLAGLLPALAMVTLAGWLITGNDPVPVRDAWPSLLLSGAAVVMLLGHIRLLDPELRVSAGPSTRRLLAGVLATALISAIVGALRSTIPEDPTTMALSVAATLMTGAGLYAALLPAVTRALAPDSGRLLQALEAIRGNLNEVGRIEELAQLVLVTLRRVARDPSGQPVLYGVAPATEARIDAAGEPRVVARSMPECLGTHLRSHPGIVVRASMEAMVVRRPAWRAVTAFLVEEDALCAVPLYRQGELEGALIIPRGRRRHALSLEELTQLTALGHRLAVLLTIFSSEIRAQRRANDAEQARKDLVEQLDATRGELSLLHQNAQALRENQRVVAYDPTLVAYSAPMKTFVQKLQEAAPLDAPVLLSIEAGDDVVNVARRLHDGSPRAGKAFVVADCASASAEGSLAALVGRDDKRDPEQGWLRLAHGGTLVLVDLPALSLDAQRALLDAIAEHHASAVGGQGSYEVDVRVIGATRIDLETRTRDGQFDPELAERMAARHIALPALRERPEDLESLILLALNRAARIRGRAPLGIGPRALSRLRAHRFPGNLAELYALIDQAVHRAAGPQVVLDDLELPPLEGTAEPRAATSTPPLATEPARAKPAGLEVDGPRDPWDRQSGTRPVLSESAGDTAQANAADDNVLEGSHSEVERRMLEHALARTDGNKSAAARLLDMKRTTFLDKLKRHGLATATSAGSVTAVANGGSPRRRTSSGTRSTRGQTGS